MLSGRGECFKRNNHFYRELVADFFPAYNACKDNNQKRATAAKIVSLVYEKGGRFLDNHGNELPKKLAVHKTMKALKDRRIAYKSPPYSRRPLPVPEMEMDESSSPSTFRQKQGAHALSKETNNAFSMTIKSRVNVEGGEKRESALVPSTLIRMFSAQARNFFNENGGSPPFYEDTWDCFKLDLSLCDDPFDENCEQELLAEALASTNQCQSFYPS